MDELCSKVQRPVEVRFGGPWMYFFRKLKRPVEVQIGEPWDKSFPEI